MGLWQNLVAGYDANHELGRVDAGGLYPLSSTTITNNSQSLLALVVISLDSNGHYLGHESILKPNKDRPLRIFPIPVSQESLNRTNSKKDIAPHPIFDYREYVFPDMIEGKQKPTDKNDAYKAQLGEFAKSAFSFPSILAVYRYVSDTTRNFEADLPEGTKPKTPILFRVNSPGISNVDLWTNPAVFNAWHSYYTQKVTSRSPKVLDVLSGQVMATASKHPKKVFALSGSAKLISSNDKNNFTFRGRFDNPGQAVSVGYESSQKAHQFLRYLIATNGIACGSQVIVPFVTRTGTDSLPAPPVTDEDEEWGEEDDDVTADVTTKLGARTGIDYAKAVGKALAGMKLETQWSAHAPAAIAVLEAATPGRLSITYYREMSRTDYLERVQLWHDRCKWPIWTRSRTTGDAKVVFGAPSFDRILQAAFGWPRGGKDDAYDTVRQRVRTRLLRTVFDNAPLPPDYLANAVRRASNPLAITANGNFSRSRFYSVLSTTCAILKHNTHNTKESFDMSIDLSRTDRDYLYGRLLGAADKLEEYALHKKDNSRLVTAAIRYMQTFSMRPATTWRIIHDSLLPYKQQVRNSIADRELKNIYALLKAGASEDDKPLSGVYLAGYYHELVHIEDLLSEAKTKKQAQTISNNNQP